MTFSLRTWLWGILLPFLLPWPVGAQEPVHISLHNLPLQDERLLVVTVQLEDVTDLYGAEIQLQFDPAQLKVRDEDPRLAGVQIAPGPLLAFDDRFVAANNVDLQTGQVNFVFTLLKPALPIKGEGVLATIVFEVTGNGPFEIKVSQAKLVSSQLTAVPATTADLTLDGPPALLGPPRPVESGTAFQPAQSARPAWVGGLAVGLLLLMALLAVFFWLRQRSGQTLAPAASGAAATGLPAAAMATTGRTSALLIEQGQRALTQADLPRAYELFNQAIELDPASAAAWLGKGLAAQPEIEKRICFQRALALEPNNSGAKEALQQLETYRNS
jgi:hypothetical protein